VRRCRLRRKDLGLALVVRVESECLAVDPMDMRAGTEAAMTRIVNVLGSARLNHAYLFANRRANRMKMTVQDGTGVWLAARRLNQFKFVWLSDSARPWR